MSEVINGVPRELLERLLDSDGIDGVFDAGKNYAAHQELRALLSEQPQSSVSCVACEGRPSGDNVPCAVCGQPQSSAAQSAPDERDLKGLVEVLNEAADILEAVGQSVPDVVERCKNWRWPLADELSGFACMLADAWQRAQSAPVVPEYTSAMGEAAQKYIDECCRGSDGQLLIVPPGMPGGFYWYELYARMLAAAPQPDQFVEATDMVTARQEQGE